MSGTVTVRIQKIKKNIKWLYVYVVLIFVEDII